MGADLARSLREAAAAALPPGAFLKLDRGDALFVTDAPRREPGGDWPERLALSGLLCREEGGLAFLAPGPGWLVRLEAEFPVPPDALSKSLSRFAGLPPEDGSLALFALGAKALEAGYPPERYDRLLRRRAALCLRQGGGGGLYACAILDHIIKGGTRL